MTTVNATPADSATRPRVLVIDDDASVRSLLTAVLQRNYQVVVANDGLAGFTKAKEFLPDVAVIDIQMPGWDGLQTLTAFRQEPLLARVQTIVLTADASRETVVAAIKAGANDYMIKTAFSRDEFNRKIARLLDSDHSTATVSSLAGLTAANNEAASASAAKSVETETASSAPPAEESSADQVAVPVSPADLQEVLDAWE